MKNRESKSAVVDARRDFHGAAYVDQSGQEVAITEEMIQTAIRELDQPMVTTQQMSSSISADKKS